MSAKFKVIFHVTLVIILARVARVPAQFVTNNRNRFNNNRIRPKVDTDLEMMTRKPFVLKSGELYRYICIFTLIDVVLNS